MERKEAICSAYRMTGGNNFYDGMITCSTLSGKAVCRLVWAMNKAENDDYLEKALSGIPEHFSGRLLEVPVGTGILTMPVYQTMPEADITCLDYSPDMMRQAREKADRLHDGGDHGDIQADGAVLLPLAILDQGGFQRDVVGNTLFRSKAGHQQVLTEGMRGFGIIKSHNGLLLSHWKYSTAARKSFMS